MHTIARRRYFRPQDGYNRGPSINDRIRANPVRLIDEKEQMIGVVPITEALSRAYEAGLDLVEVAPDSSPPVCRILDFGKYKYELAKKEKANKARAKTAELKEVRMGRSMKIDPHDIAIRINQARKFLLEGHKVQIVQNFRGREMVHRARGNQRMQDIIQALSDLGKVETPPRMAGRRMTMILSPDKAKIEQYKKSRKAGQAGPDQAASDAGDGQEKQSRGRSETGSTNNEEGGAAEQRARPAGREAGAVV